MFIKVNYIIIILTLIVLVILILLKNKKENFSLDETKQNIEIDGLPLKLEYYTDFKSSSKFNKEWNKINNNISFYSIRMKDNVSTHKDNGLFLKIKENNDPTTQFNSKTGLRLKWTAGYIESKNTYGYGYYEASYTNSKASGGINNAFWLYSHTSKEEIDINEGEHKVLDFKTGKHRGYAQGAYHDWHWLSKPVNNKDNYFHKGMHYTNLDSKIDVTKEPVAYGLLITPTYIKWYINQKEVKLDKLDTINGKSQYKYDIKVGYGNPLDFLVRFSIAIGELGGKIKDGVDNNKDITGTNMNIKEFKYYRYNPETLYTSNKYSILKNLRI